MKNILTMKNLIAAILAGLAMIFIIPLVNPGADMVPLDADGDYSYPDFCIGHEEDFLVNAHSLEYQRGGYVYDVEYIGSNGDFAYKDLHLGLSTFDAETNSFYNESLNFGFKLPDGWQAVSPTPLSDEKYTFIYDFGAVSPDGKYSIAVKYHDIGTDNISVRKFADYFDMKTDPYYARGFTDITHSSIFAGDKYCSLALCADRKNTANGKYYVASQILDYGHIMIIEYHTPHENKHQEVWENFYSPDVNSSAFAQVTYLPRSSFDSETNYISNPYTNIEFTLPEKWTIYTDSKSLGQLHNLTDEECTAFENGKWSEIESIDYMPDYTMYGEKGGDKISVVYYPISEDTTAESCREKYVEMFRKINSDIAESRSTHSRMHPLLPSNINADGNAFEAADSGETTLENAGERQLEFYTAQIKAEYWGKNAYEYGAFAQINDDYIIGILFSTASGTDAESFWDVLGF